MKNAIDYINSTLESLNLEGDAGKLLKAQLTQYLTEMYGIGYAQGVVDSLNRLKDEE